MKIAICGPGRCGKDTAAHWLKANTSLRYSRSTSEVIVPHVAKKLGLSVEETYRKRHEFRQLMFETGIELRQNDPAFLARTVLAEGDICNGVRDRREMQAVLDEQLVDLAIWIDRPWLPPDPTMGYGLEMCDIIIPNCWGLVDFIPRIARLARTWGVL